MTDRHNLAVAFERRRRDDPSATALVVGDDRWSRADIDDLAGRAAARLQALGARPGDAVVAQYNTTAVDIALAVAAARTGCTFMPIPHSLGPYEFNYVLELADPVLLALHDVSLVSRLEVPARTAVASSDDVVTETRRPVPFAEEPPGHVAVVGFTSGSTGRPKGVMHRWPSMAWTSQFLAALVSQQPGEPICVTGAGAGVPGFTFYTYHGLVQGAPIVAAERWDPRRVLELMVREGCIWSTMVPTMVHMMLEVRRSDPSTPVPDTMRAISVGGAFMSEDLIRAARTELHLEVLRVYAMAECMMACQMRLSDPPAERDVYDGWTGPGAEVAVFANDGRTHLASGEVGELGLKGASLFEGYLGDPTTKAERSTPDGFFLSGDMGRVTVDGFVKVVGRMKDMIIRGGYNIDPVEVEELIRRHDGVLDVAVVGFADERYGERAAAFVLPREGVDIDLPSLSEFLLGHGLSKQKLPERLEVVPDLPRSPDGKILKGELRRRLAG